MDFKQPSISDPSCAKILMLHGHGQSGQFFRCKTQFLQRRVEKFLYHSLPKDPKQGSFDRVEFHYPSGLLPANPDHPRGESISMRAWGHGDVELDRIEGLECNIHYILHFIETHGPFIGIMGFSTGATVAIIVASLLEKRRSISGLQFNIRHPPLKFAVSFSGFPLGHPLYEPIYSPKIETPTLHVIGTMDTMIDETQSLRLQNSCKDSFLYYFFGTHYVPRSEDFLNALDGFFEQIFKDSEGNEDEWENLEG